MAVSLSVARSAIPPVRDTSEALTEQRQPRRRFPCFCCKFCIEKGLRAF